MVYLILGGICLTVGTWDWLVTACFVLGAIDIAYKVIKVIKRMTELKGKER